jgi:hypothetical protein
MVQLAFLGRWFINGLPLADLRVLVAPRLWLELTCTRVSGYSDWRMFHHFSLWLMVNCAASGLGA